MNKNGRVRGCGGALEAPRRLKHSKTRITESKKQAQTQQKQGIAREYPNHERERLAQIAPILVLHPHLAAKGGHQAFFGSSANILASPSVILNAADILSTKYFRHDLERFGATLLHSQTQERILGPKHKTPLQSTPLPYAVLTM